MDLCYYNCIDMYCNCFDDCYTESFKEEEHEDIVFKEIALQILIGIMVIFTI